MTMTMHAMKLSTCKRRGEAAGSGGKRLEAAQRRVPAGAQTTPGLLCTHGECDDERGDERDEVDDRGDDALRMEHVLELAHRPEQKGRAKQRDNVAKRVQRAKRHKVGRRCGRKRGGKERGGGGVARVRAGAAAGAAAAPRPFLVTHAAAKRWT